MVFNVCINKKTSVARLIKQGLGGIKPLYRHAKTQYR